MSDPNSRQGELIPKLAEFLSNETIFFYPDIDWLYYSNDHDPEMSPRGAVYIPKAKPSFQRNFEFFPVDYQIFIRLLISKENEFELIKSLESWCGFLLEEPLRKLRISGYENYFVGININEATIVPNINQDRGGTGQVMIVLNWNDDALVAGDRYR